MTPEHPEVNTEMISDATATPARIRIEDAGRHVGETAVISGWLYNLRRSGKIAFPIVRDGSGVMQCVAVKSSLPEELFEAIKNLTQESSIVVTGRIRAEQRAPNHFATGQHGFNLHHIWAGVNAGTEIHRY